MLAVIVDNMIGLGLIFAAVILGIFIYASSNALVRALYKLKTDKLARYAAMDCIYELVEKLNKEFPGSDIKVIDNTTEVKIIGELKYYKNERV